MTAPAPTLARVDSVEVAKGQVLCRFGDPDDAFFRVEAGLVKLVSSDPSRDDATLGLAGPGGTFGELSLIAARRREYGAVALVPSHLTRVRGAHADIPGLGTSVLAVLAAGIRVQEDCISRIQMQTSSSRLAHLLLDLASLSDSTDCRTHGFSPGISQFDLAQLLGSSRETVNRCIVEFERRGWVRRTPRRVLVHAHTGISAHARRDAQWAAGLVHQERAAQARQRLCCTLGLPTLDPTLNGARRAPCRHLQAPPATTDRVPNPLALP